MPNLLKVTVVGLSTLEEFVRGAKQLVSFLHCNQNWVCFLCAENKPTDFSTSSAERGIVGPPPCACGAYKRSLQQLP